jgi:hypothetical protein
VKPLMRSLAAGTAIATVAAAALAAGGCYSYVPLYTAPDPGTRVAFELNDRGRVALEQNIGPDVAVVEGLLQQKSDSELVVAISEIRSLYGDQSKWAGETVMFRPEYLRSMREKRYSRGRTYLVAGAVATGTVMFMVTRSLIGTGGGGSEGPPGTVPPASQ